MRIIGKVCWGWRWCTHRGKLGLHVIAHDYVITFDDELFVRIILVSGRSAADGPARTADVRFDGWRLATGHGALTDHLVHGVAPTCPGFPTSGLFLWSILLVGFKWIGGGVEMKRFDDAGHGWQIGAHGMPLCWCGWDAQTAWTVRSVIWNNK